MKNLTSKISALIIILALTFGTQAKAEKDSASPDKKETVRVKMHAPLLKFILEVFELNETDVVVLNQQFDELEGITVCYYEQDIELVIDSDAIEILDFYNEYHANPFEDWMFDELIEEEVEPIEDWMFDELVEEEAQPLEDWMFNELAEEEEEQQIEEWMLNELVLEEEGQAIEDWMFEELISDEENQPLEDWMFE